MKNGVKMVICQDCGKEVKDAKFCSNCGSLLQKADESVVEEVETKVDEVVDEIPVEEEPVEEAAEEEPAEDPVDEAVVEEVVEEEPVEEAVEEEPAEEPVDEVPAEDVTKEEAEDIPIGKKSKFCSNCGTEVTPQTVFCPQCGFKLIGEEKPQTKFCQNCGKKIDINAEVCPYCGVRVANAAPSEVKNVLLAAILSFLFPGLGHLYLGLNKKGISFIVAYIVSAILIMLFVGLVLVIIVWLWALIDSIKSTEAINKGEYVEDKLF